MKYYSIILTVKKYILLYITIFTLTLCTTASMAASEGEPPSPKDKNILSKKETTVSNNKTTESDSTENINILPKKETTVSVNKTAESDSTEDKNITPKQTLNAHSKTSSYIKKIEVINDIFYITSLDTQSKKKIIFHLDELELGKALIAGDYIKYSQEMQSLYNGLKTKESTSPYNALYMLPLLKLQHNKLNLIELMVTTKKHKQFFATEMLSLLTALMISDIYVVDGYNKKNAPQFLHTDTSYFLNHLLKLATQHKNIYAKNAISSFIPSYKQIIQNTKLQKAEKIKLLKNSPYNLTQAGISLLNGMLMGMFLIPVGNILITNHPTINQGIKDIINVLPKFNDNVVKPVSVSVSERMADISPTPGFIPNISPIIDVVDKMVNTLSKTYSTVETTLYPLITATDNVKLLMGTTSVLLGTYFIVQGVSSCKKTFQKYRKIRRVKAGL